MNKALLADAIATSAGALMVPGQATAPGLIIVEVLMMITIKNVNFDDFEESLPAFFTIAIMAFTYSISNGIGAGLIFYPITKLAAGRAKDIHPLVYFLAIIFILNLHSCLDSRLSEI